MGNPRTTPRKIISEITREMLVSNLDYWPQTGDFFWRERTLESFSKNERPEVDWRWWQRKVAGRKAGHFRDDGYRVLYLSGRKYFAHRAAYMMIYGCAPEQIDHVNGNPSDNRLENLRGCRMRSNQFNVKIPSTNTSGFKGVNWCKKRGMWEAKIKVDKKTYWLGYFDSPIGAAIAYDEAATEKHGNYAKTNKLLGLLEA